MSCVYADRSDAGECRGVIANHRPFRSSASFEMCERHVALDASIAARAGTPGYCFCGHPVLNAAAVAERKAMDLSANANRCIVHQRGSREPVEIRERRYREADERDMRAAYEDRG